MAESNGEATEPPVTDGGGGSRVKGWNAWSFDRKVVTVMTASVTTLLLLVVVVQAIATSGAPDKVVSVPSASDASELDRPKSAPLVTTTTPPFVPSTPAEKVAVEAIRNGWDEVVPFSRVGDTATRVNTIVKWVQERCDKLAADYVQEMDYIATGIAAKPGSGFSYGAQFAALVETGLPVLCPQFGATVVKIRAGDYAKMVGPGRYLVGAEIEPGTYIATGRMTDCYWERTDKNGNIIDNAFVSIAERLTVTIGPGDGGFRTEGCAAWVQQR